MDYSIVTGTSAISQVVIAILIIVGLLVLLSTAETITSWITRIDKMAVDLIPNTVGSSTMKRIVQNPSTPEAITLPRSDNERDGLEFSYSMWLFIDPATFSGNPGAVVGAPQSNKPKVLKHVMHKGTNGMFPLLAPGVFINAEANELVVIMNTFDAWNNMVIIRNIPVQKWLHLVISAKGKAMDVYLNGNVVARKTFASFPKQNYGDVYFFSTQAKRMGPDTAPFPSGPGAPSDSIVAGLGCWAGTDASLSGVGKAQRLAEIQPYVSGPFVGNLSRARYYSYALSFAEISGLVREGPSTKVDTSSQDRPPYMTDSWWVSSYTQPLP